MTTTTQAGYRELPLIELHESPLNPRKLFNQAALVELADSLRASGIITPLIVRPNAKGYEIAAGHRRYRAAKMANLETVPAIVRPMDDAEFVEILNIENLQRQDLSALEEAEGYKLLMTKAGYDVKRIAERVGLSEKYIYDRVKLLNLIPAAQTLLRDHKITAGHAILIARQKDADQKKIIDPAGDALWQHEMVLDDPTGDGPITDPQKAKSVRELEAWIDLHIRFDARAVDPMLLPETAEVLAQVQPKEKVVHITHDSYIQESARDEKERTITPRSWERADGKHGSKTCEHAVLGVVGPGKGEAFKVCIAKEKCKVHWAKWQKERGQRARAASTSSASSSADTYKRQEDRRRQEEARQEAERKRWKEATPAILEAIAAAVKKAPTKAGGLLGQIILEALDQGSKGAAAYVPRGSSADDLVRHAAFVVLHSEAADSWFGPERFPKRAKAFGIDVAKILDKEAPKPAAAATSKGKKK